MSFYNMINGATAATFLVLPMLGKHPDEYPRFRNCFLSDEGHPEYNDHIHVYTRVGGGNRNGGFGEQDLYAHPEYVTTFDDSFDDTYGTYVFKVPEKWKNDFDLFKQGKIKEFSKEYQKEIIRVYPKLKDQLSVLWENQEVGK